VHWLLRLMGSLAAQQQQQQPQRAAGDTPGRIQPASRLDESRSSLLPPKGNAPLPPDVSDACGARVRSPRVRIPRQRSGAAPTLSGRWPVHILNTVQVAVKPASQPSHRLTQRRPEPIRNDKRACEQGSDTTGTPRFRVELLPVVA
jgi:hypothetical protein